MLIGTKCFGKVDIEEEKIIHFPDGILGFEKLRDYTIIYDISNGKKAKIAWLQSTEEPGLALPVINPFDVMDEYNPSVEEELLSILGDVTSENIIVLLVVTVPTDVMKTTANMKAPIIINAESRLGVQVIVENKDYPIKHPIINKDKEGNKC